VVRAGRRTIVATADIVSLDGGAHIAMMLGTFAVVDDPG